MPNLDEPINPVQIIKSIRNNDPDRFEKPIGLAFKAVRVKEEIKFAFKTLRISQILVYRHLPLYNLKNLKIIILVIIIVESTQNDNIIVKSGGN
tara:strand:+ start:318 stop:599 length:282 start_codon:yes stop_codon:yes gene_type:complete